MIVNLLKLKSKTLIFSTFCHDSKPSSNFSRIIWLRLKYNFSNEGISFSTFIGTCFISFPLKIRVSKDFRCWKVSLLNSLNLLLEKSKCFSCLRLTSMSGMTTDSSLFAKDRILKFGTSSNALGIKFLMLLSFKDIDTMYSFLGNLEVNFFLSILYPFWRSYIR